MNLRKSSLHELLEKRQTGGIVPPISDLLSAVLYRCNWQSKSCVPPHYTSTCGAVFNIEFSPTDSAAVAVCANGAFTTHDPRRPDKVHIVPHAHNDGANCVTFLSDYAFVTCSDDTTIKLWDLRNLRQSVAVFKGHTGWVKNIEYDTRSGLLFSVAFHDGVRAWSIHDPELHKREADNLVLPLKDAVRLRIAPDSTRLFVCLRRNTFLLLDNFNGMMFCSEKVELMRHLTSRRRRETEVNRLTMHTLSEIKQHVGFRSVLSASFHPSGNFIALRHVDIQDSEIVNELLSLYDLREPSTSSIERNYLKYANEANEEDSADIIKEIHFSSDGKVIASPYRCGVRLLAVDADCTPADVFFDDRFHSRERDLCSPDMEVVHELSGHRAAVLTSRFAHHDMLLASGCSEGVVHFHQPQL